MVTSREPASAFRGVTVSRRHPLLLVLSAAILGGSALLLVTGALADWTQLSLTPIVLIVVLSRAPWMRRYVAVTVGVRDDNVLVDGVSIGPIRSITSAFIVPEDGIARTLRLVRRRRPAVELRVRDEDRAVALMRALGLGPTQWAASYALPAQRGDRRQPWVTGLASVSAFALFIGACSTHGAPSAVLFGGFLLALLGVVIIAATSAFTPRLSVGTDGISIIMKGRARFIAYGEMAKVEIRLLGRRWGIGVVLVNGETLGFDVRSSEDRIQGAEEEYDRRGLDPRQILARIEEARAAARRGAEVDPALLSSSGPPPDRIRALRALGRTGDGDYRRAGLSTEQLWRTFESTSAAPEARAGAAIALRARLDEACRQRLRIVAASTAAPGLRAAIESAAEDDDDALAEALAALDAEAPGGERKKRAG